MFCDPYSLASGWIAGTAQFLAAMVKYSTPHLPPSNSALAVAVGYEAHKIDIYLLLLLPLLPLLLVAASELAKR